MEKIVKSRGEYTCDCCGKPIIKGEKHTFGKGKGPRYDEFYTQIGITFYQYRLCLNSIACNKRLLESEESAVAAGELLN